MLWSNVAEIVGINFSLFDLLRMKFKFFSFSFQYLLLFFHNQKNFQRSIFKFVDPPGPARHVVILIFFRRINGTRKSAKRKHHQTKSATVSGIPDHYRVAMTATFSNQGWTY